ncbi:deiodinase family protein [Tautonia marina]|uniref:deiodinase family protein n=1 Tax=Tautonia marina TaxID=2653855 RepID=UPI001260DC50|nr:deiodinase family protein [Tautonia marina]
MNKRFPIEFPSRSRRLAVLSVGLLVVTLTGLAQAQEGSGDGSTAKVMSPAARAFWDSELAGRLGNWLAKRLEQTPSEQRPEWMLMLTDILRGSQLNASDGWFRRPTGGSRFSWTEVRSRLDMNNDGFVSQEEWPGTADDFIAVDRTGDGLITRDDFDWSEHALAGGPGTALFYLADTDGNGKVGRAEFLALFERLDRGDLGFLSRDELKGVFNQGTFNRLMMEPGIKGEGLPPSPEGPSKSTLIRGLFTQEIGSLWPGPGIGDVAPDFTLGSVDGDRDVTLSAYRERLDKPVVLIFGNFTCGPFRSQAGNIEKLFRRYRDRAGFLLVYVREAHPTDGWHMFDNFRQGYTLPQPTDDAGRVEVARLCQRTLDLGMPMVVDSIEDPVGTLYSGMPARLYLIDREGLVAFKSGRGPFGFKPAELEQALALLLMEEAQAHSQIDDEAGAQETR